MSLVTPPNSNGWNIPLSHCWSSLFCSYVAQICSVDQNLSWNCLGMKKQDHGRDSGFLGPWILFHLYIILFDAHPLCLNLPIISTLEFSVSLFLKILEETFRLFWTFVRIEFFLFLCHLQYEDVAHNVWLCSELLLKSLLNSVSYQKIVTII